MARKTAYIAPDRRILAHFNDPDVRAGEAFEKLIYRERIHVVSSRRVQCLTVSLRLPVLPGFLRFLPVRPSRMSCAQSIPSPCMTSMAAKPAVVSALSAMVAGPMMSLAPRRARTIHAARRATRVRPMIRKSAFRISRLTARRMTMAEADMAGRTTLAARHTSDLLTLWAAPQLTGGRPC